MIKKMLEKLERPSVFRKVLIIAFLTCFGYWTYLLFASQMSITVDAIAYENVGLMIYKKGWIEFFKTGPQREPLYSFTIAISMRIADMFAISYQTVQKIIQMMFLFATQILILVLLNKLKVNNKIKLITVLYFGFSPGIVNSAFSLLSEIVTYPFILAAVLFGALSWRAIHNSRPKTIAILSLATSLSFVFVTFAKAIFQYVFLLFLIPYFCIAINSIRKRNKVILSRSILYITVAVLVFNSFIIPFKLMNKRFNGHFEFTDRYTDLLLGNALKRANPLTPRIFLAHLASIPGTGVCRLFFSEEECRYTEFHGADHIRATVMPKLLANTPGDNIKSKMLSLTFKKVIENPFQYVLFMAIEAARMPFWESTRLSFVIYPAWLENLFSFKLFKNGIRLVISVLTYFSLFNLMLIIFKKRSVLFNSRLDEGKNLIICFFILLLIFSYTGLYSLFSILARFSLPMAPLYLVCIAYSMHNRIYKE